MNYRMGVGVWAITALALLVACGSGGSQQPQQLATSTSVADEPVHDLVVFAPKGGRLVYNSIEMMIKASGLSYDVTLMEGVTTELTIQGLKNGTFDLVFMHRTPYPDEGIRFFELLHANVAIYTHPDVGVDSLTLDQLAAIFSGEITNWSEVGGADQTIVPFVMPEFDSTTAALRAKTLGEKPFSSAAHLLPDETSVMLSATGISGGITYATWATKKYLELANPGTRTDEFHVISLDGMSINDPNYPVSIVLGFGYLPEQTDYLEPLFDWVNKFLLSPQGQQLLQTFDLSASVGG